MKEGWELATVAQVAKISSGNSAPQDKVLFEGGIYPFIRTSDVGKIKVGAIGDARDYLNEDGIKRLREFPKGTILFPKSGASTFLNHRVILERSAYVSSHLATIIPDETRILSKFLLYFLVTIRAQNLIQDHKYPSLKRADIEGISLLLPDLPKQQRIVAILDEAFDGIATATANAEKNLANAKELLVQQIEKEIANASDDWIVTTVGEICSKFEYGTSSKSLKRGNTPVLRMGNIQKGEFDWSDLVYSDDQSDIERYQLKPRDVLFNRTNSLEHVGKSAIYRGEQHAIFAGYLIRLHYDPERVDPEFLNLFLNSKGARQYGRTISGKSVNQANISASKLKTYPISLPPLSRQRQIADCIVRLREPIESLIVVYETKVASFTKLKQSILQKAFAGELH